MLKNFLIAMAFFALPAYPQDAGAQDRPTADQAKNNLSDRSRMQKIRRSVMADKSLSTDAHNVKIISQNGKVTLRGPVRSEEEHQAVLARAREVAGEGNVDDQITIKGDSARK